MGALCSKTDEDSTTGPYYPVRESNDDDWFHVDQNVLKASHMRKMKMNYQRSLASAEHNQEKGGPVDGQDGKVHEQTVGRESVWVRQNYYRQTSILPMTEPTLESIDTSMLNSSGMSSGVLFDQSGVTFDIPRTQQAQQTLQMVESSPVKSPPKRKYTEAMMRQVMPIATNRKLRKMSKSGSSLLNHVSREDIRLIYTFKQKLGSGSFGTVRVAYKTLNPSVNFAIKSIKRKEIENSSSQEQDLIQELMILLSCDHPNIVRLFEIYLDHEYLHLVTELCEGGTISPDSQRNGRFTEAEAARIVRQSLQALNYLHELQIVHRDLKPENILFFSNKKFVKLIDFGFANLCKKKKEELTETKGTPYYISPEVLRGKYDKRCDLWSMGVITFELLCGKAPFQGQTYDELNAKILSTDYEFEDEDWRGISSQAKDFIAALIEPRVDKRLSCEEALIHDWIVHNQPRLSVTEKNEIVEIFLRLKNCQKLTRFQMALRMIFQRLVDDERATKNLQAFQSIDDDNSGQLDHTEMSLAIEGLLLIVPELDFTAEDIDDTFDKLDQDNVGLITYSQFLIATLDPALLEDPSLLRTLFNELDTFQEGFLTKESIQIAMNRQGHDISEEAILKVFSMMGFDPEKKINFDAYKNILIGGN